MPRYIDADALVIKLPDDLPYKASVKRVLLQAPTLDVVPREEVAKIFEEIDATIDLICAMTGVDVAIFGKYAELKKKYTEDSTDGKRTDR